MCCSTITVVITVIGIIGFVKPLARKPASDFCHTTNPIPIHAKQTLLNHTQSVFEQYGYSDFDVPKNLNEFKTSVMSQSAVLRYVNKYGEWIKLGESDYSIIYLGEIKATKKKVIIKEYTKKPDINDIEEEARIMLYMSDYFPKFYGYVPHGQYTGNLSLVIEFIQNGETLHGAMRHDDIELGQVLSIFHQLASAVKTMHERFVLHNDLHAKNVMVQWDGGEPKVRMIDTGLSSFRSGMVGRISTGYSFYPPEYRKNEETTPSTDVFGLGYLFDLEDVSFKNPHLQDLAKWCKSDRAIDRPSAHKVVNKIEEIAKLYNITLNREAFTHSLRPGSRFIEAEEIKYPILNEREITINCSSSYMYPEEMTTCPGIYKNRTVYVHLIIEGREYDEKRRILSFLAVVYLASELDMIPRIHGIIFPYRKSKFFVRGIVQEYVSGTVNLEVALREYGQRNWTMLYRAKIALKIAEIVLHFHDRNQVVNNIELFNFLYREITDETTSPIIMLSELNEISDVSDHWEETDDEDVSQPNLYQFDIYKIGELYKELFRTTEMPEELFTLLYEENDVAIVEIQECLCHVLGEC